MTQVTLESNSLVWNMFINWSFLLSLNNDFGGTNKIFFSDKDVDNKEIS